MRRTTTSKVSLGAAGALALTLALTTAAHADYGPTLADTVGVGSDTVQYVVSFTADGDNLGDAGYNSAGNANKYISFDATADANGRAAYLPSTATLNPTIVLRAGSVPVQRPNGSGAGIGALLADTGATEQINYVRSSRQPKLAEQNSAGAKGWGFLHVVQIAQDPLQVAVATTSNAPAGISINELVGIYKCTTTTWNALPGNSGGSTNTIKPIIPQTGSGTRGSFLSDLKAANGNVDVVLGACVVTSEEHDPTAIAGNPDAIGPFSVGRFNLYNSGYFHDPNTAFPGGTSVAPGIKMVTGTPGDANPAYSNPRGLYVIYRDSDRTITTPWQPGGTKNWVNTLFSGTSPYVKSAAGQTLINASGATAAYNDLGNVFSG